MEDWLRLIKFSAFLHKISIFVAYNVDKHIDNFGIACLLLYYIGFVELICYQDKIYHGDTEVTKFFIILRDLRVSVV